MMPPFRDPTTNETELVVDWNAMTGASSGGLSITSYNLQWDNSTGGLIWYDLAG